MKVELICEHCGKTVMIKPSAKAQGRKHCSWQCRINAKQHTHFKSNGYMHAWDGSKYVLEHRLVMETLLGRKLLPDEQVHHINRIKHDNTPTNLMLIIGGCREHQLLHGKEQYHIFHTTVPCSTCGTLLHRTVSELKRRNGHAFCSNECFRKSDAFRDGNLNKSTRCLKKAMTMKTAICKKCGCEKSVGEFRLRKDGAIFTYTCKECIRIQAHTYQKIWYSNPINQDRAKARANARYEEIKNGRL